MTLGEFNSRSTALMKAFIRERKHVRTGHLLNSIKFKSTFRNGELDVKYNSKFYIVYLEDGDFQYDFFKLPSYRNLYKEFIVSQVQLELNFS